MGLCTLLDTTLTNKKIIMSNFPDIKIETILRQFKLADGDDELTLSIAKKLVEVYAKIEDLDKEWKLIKSDVMKLEIFNFKNK